MLRTQIQLTEPQAAKLKRLATARGVSMAEIIREAVDGLSDKDDRALRFARAANAITSGRNHDIGGKTDVARRHDDYLAEIYAEKIDDR